MSRSALIIGSLVTILVLLALAIVVSLGVIFAPVTAGGVMPGPVRIESLPVSIGWAAIEKTEVEEKSVPAPQGTALEVDSQIGNVAVTGAEVQEIQVRATKHGRGDSPEAAAEDLKNLQLDVLQQPGKVVVNTHRIPAAPNRNSSIDLEVTVPFATATSIRASLGNVVLSGTRQSTTINASLGNVDLSGIQGDVEVNASMGNVDIRDTNPARTLRIADKLGNVSFQGGIPSAGEGNVVASMGNVSIDIPASSSASIEATANMGKITSDMAGQSSSQGAGSSLKASMGGGGFRLSVQNKLGNIDLKTHR